MANYGFAAQALGLLGKQYGRAADAERQALIEQQKREEAMRLEQQKREDERRTMGLLAGLTDPEMAAVEQYQRGGNPVTGETPIERPLTDRERREGRTGLGAVEEDQTTVQTGTAQTRRYSPQQEQGIQYMLDRLAKAKTAIMGRGSDVKAIAEAEDQQLETGLKQKLIKTGEPEKLRLGVRALKGEEQETFIKGDTSGLYDIRSGAERPRQFGDTGEGDTAKDETRNRAERTRRVEAALKSAQTERAQYERVLENASRAELNSDAVKQRRKELDDEVTKWKGERDALLLPDQQKRGGGRLPDPLSVLQDMGAYKPAPSDRPVPVRQAAPAAPVRQAAPAAPVRQAAPAAPVRQAAPAQLSPDPLKRAYEIAKMALPQAERAVRDAATRGDTAAMMEAQAAYTELVRTIQKYEGR